MSASQAGEFERAIRGGGVVLFPADTIYGLACDPANEFAIDRLYALKGRPPEKASAVMFFDLAVALSALTEMPARTRAAVERLVPGPVTVLVPNPAHRFALCAPSDPGTLGVRVVDVPVLRGVRVPVLQSSANPAGGAEARRLADVAPAVRAGADLEVDGGELPGTASTIIDLRRYETDGEWSIVRSGGMDASEVARRLTEEPREDATSTGTLESE